MFETCACGSSVDVGSNGRCANCARKATFIELSVNAERSRRSLTVALWSAAVCFFALLPITIGLCILTKAVGDDDCLWIRAVTVLFAAALGVPGIILGALTLLKVRRAAPAAAAGTVAIAAIIISAMSLGEGVWVTTSVVPSWQNMVDRMHG